MWNVNMFAIIYYAKEAILAWFLKTNVKSKNQRIYSYCLWSEQNACRSKKIVSKVVMQHKLYTTVTEHQKFWTLNFGFDKVHEVENWTRRAQCWGGMFYLHLDSLIPIP